MTEDSVGKFIQKKRKEFKMTQKDLAKEVRVTEQAVSKWERGLAYPDITLIPKIAEIFDVSVEDIMLSENKDSNNKSEDLILAANKISEKTNQRKKNIAFILSSVIIAFVIGLLSIINFLTNSISNSNLFWSAIPSVSLGFVWLLLIGGIYIRKFKFVYLSTVASAGTLALLFVIEYITPVKNWALEIGFPVVIFVFFALIIGAFLKSKKINNFLTAAFGTFVALLISILVNNFLLPNYFQKHNIKQNSEFCVNANFPDEINGELTVASKPICIKTPDENAQKLSQTISYSSLGALTAAFLITGIIKQKRS